METFDVDISEADFQRLNEAYPQSMASGSIARRTEQIVKLHFESLYPGCRFETPPPGTDLSVKLLGAEHLISIEIKGTASADIAWQQLKVSSPHSWKSLTESGTPVYRVTNVFGRVPKIFVLIHGRDFSLIPEPRWAFKKIASQNEGHKVNRPFNQIQSHSLEQPRNGSKYDALRVYLLAQTSREVTLRFDDAPHILGFELPASALTHQAYWANQTNTKNRPWARAWQEAGFKVDGYHLSRQNGWVRFSRKNEP